MSANQVDIHTVQKQGQLRLGQRLSNYLQACINAYLDQMRLGWYEVLECSVDEHNMPVCPLRKILGTQAQAINKDILPGVAKQ